MMFSSLQSPQKPHSLQTQKPLAELASLDLEILLAQGDRRHETVVDGETRQQILQSFALRMRQVSYLRRLPASKLSQ